MMPGKRKDEHLLHNFASPQDYVASQLTIVLSLLGNIVFRKHFRNNFRGLLCLTNGTHNFWQQRKWSPRSCCRPHAYSPWMQYQRLRTMCWPILLRIQDKPRYTNRQPSTRSTVSECKRIPRRRNLSENGRNSCIFKASRQGWQRLWTEAEFSERLEFFIRDTVGYDLQGMNNSRSSRRLMRGEGSKLSRTPRMGLQVKTKLDFHFSSLLLKRFPAYLMFAWHISRDSRPGYMEWDWFNWRLLKSVKEGVGSFRES